MALSVRRGPGVVYAAGYLTGTPKGERVPVLWSLFMLVMIGADIIAMVSGLSDG